MSAADQLDVMIDKFTPALAQQARSVLARMREHLPSAALYVYDNYNGLVIGFVPGEHASEALFSVIVYPRYISLAFLQGVRQQLDDPHGMLRGEGTTVRHVRLTSPATLDEPAVQALIEQAIARAAVPFDPTRPPTLEIRAVQAKQRPRRP